MNLIAWIGAATFLPIMVALFFITPLVWKLGKRNAALAGVLVGIVGGGVKKLGRSSLTLFIIEGVLQTVAIVPLLGIGLAMLADTVEYGEWKSEVRTDGLANSGGKENVLNGVPVNTWPVFL